MVATAECEVRARGVGLDGTPQPLPAVLQMNLENFPKRFLHDLAAPDQAPLAGAQDVSAVTTEAQPVLYQPVQRMANVALAELSCCVAGDPRLDPTKVLSAGMVVRRVQRVNGVDLLSGPPSAWVSFPDGTSRWQALDGSQEDDDPVPALRPQPFSGQTGLDKLLTAQALASASTEATTPVFMATPEICEALGRTVAYGLVPTASSEASDASQPSPQYDSATLASSLTTLLQAGDHNAPQAGQYVDYTLMSDENARNSGKSDFLTFSATLRMLHGEFGAFDGSAAAQQLLNILNGHNVTFVTISGMSSVTYTRGMGDFYSDAKEKLFDYDPNADPPQAVPQLLMPVAWESFTQDDQDQIVSQFILVLQARSAKVLAPRGRFQDRTRLYKLRVFFRVKPHAPSCPPMLVWSEYSQPFRIAAWYEGPGRLTAPVPLPDPTRAFLGSAKPNCSFAVPAGLMNAMQNSSMKKLMDGSNGGGGGGIKLDWICGFNIPLITICAFFVLNIFLILLNIIFWWLPFIKICIPFPVPAPGTSSGDEP